jgi:NADH/F420H2 dehydrogenase subunit C
MFNKNECNSFLPILTSIILKEQTLFIVNQANLLLSLNVFKNHISLQYKVLSCISGVDFLGSLYRFSIVYDLLSVRFNKRIRLKVFLNELTNIKSSVKIFRSSDWWEREIWDLFGIYFEDHGDLRRILTDYGFDGHPLRKDFPLSGYIELKFNLKSKQLTLEPVEFSQEFRCFNFETPWK